MKDELVNRLGMFDTSLANLNKAENKAVWFNQPPVVFTTKVTDATTAVMELREYCRKQETAITGATQEKEREGQEAIGVAHTLGRALVTWFRDQGDETNAAKLDLTESAWRRLRDQALVEKGRLARDLGQGVVAGAQAAAAVGYGITGPAVAAVDKEVEEYAQVVSAPQTSIADRKSITGQLRARFNTVETKFAVLDDLILQFHATTAGRALIASHQAARIVRDLGHGPGPKPPAPPAPSQ